MKRLLKMYSFVKSNATRSMVLGANPTTEMTNRTG